MRIKNIYIWFEYFVDIFFVWRGGHCKTVHVLRVSLTLSLPNATVVECTVHCQTQLQSKFKGTVDSCLF